MFFAGTNNSDLPRLRASSVIGIASSKWWKIVSVVCVIWFLFAVLAAVANFFDLRMLGMKASIPEQIQLFVVLLSPKIILSCYLAIYYERHQDEVLRARAMFGIFFWLMLVFLPINFLFEGFFVVVRRDPALLSWNSVVDSISPMSLWLNMVLINFAYSMQLAYSFWRQHYLQLRLQQLQGQLEPYFLLSSLEDITELVTKADSQLATKALARLSELLRHVLEAAEDEWRSVDDELDVLRDYLSLQRLRFGEHLQVEWQLGGNLWSEFACPPMLFLPLLDATVRAHATELYQQPKSLVLRCERIDQQVRFSIELRSDVASIRASASAFDEVQERIRLTFAHEGECDERVLLNEHGRHLMVFVSFPARARDDE
jgi:hypothetical protein